MHIIDVPIASVRVDENRRAFGNVTALAESISQVGLLNPITVTEGNQLIAGRSRLEACRSLGWTDIPATIFGSTEENAALYWELAEIDENLIRNDLTVLEQAEQTARRKRVYEKLYPEAPTGAGRPKKNAEIISAFTEDTAKKTGVSARTVRHAVQIATAFPEAVRDTIRELPIADNKTELLKLARMTPPVQERVVTVLKSRPDVSFTEAKRQVGKEDLAEAPPMPSAKYRVLYADPPWSHSSSGLDHYGAAERHYSALTIEEMKLLPIVDLAEENAVLFMWVTSSMLEECFEVINAWGFKYKASFVWDKVKHSSGHYNSVRHELLLICTRGSCQPDSGKLVDSVQTIERTERGAKPEEFRTIIDEMYTNGKRIELFARGSLPDGWEGWGNEHDADFNRESVSGFKREAGTVTALPGSPAEEYLIDRGIPADPPQLQPIAPVTAADPQGTGIMRVPTETIISDPSRLQFRLTPRSLPVDKWDEQLAGVMCVWPDPANGGLCVVDGHNRLAKAKQQKVPTVLVWLINAATVEEARAFGAWMNIAQEHANAIDVAKFFRDKRVGTDELNRRGVKLSNKLIADGLALSKLTQALFMEVVRGDMSVDRGAAIGRYLDDPDDQVMLKQMIVQREKHGGKVTPDMIESFVRDLKSAPEKRIGGGGLFGDDCCAINAAWEKAKLREDIRMRIVRDKRLLSQVSDEEVAERLRSVGNIINVDDTALAAEQAKIALEVFDKLADKIGTLVSAALREGASKFVSVEKVDAKAIREETYKQIRQAILKFVGSMTRSGDERSVPVGEVGINSPAGEQLAPLGIDKADTGAQLYSPTFAA